MILGSTAFLRYFITHMNYVILRQRFFRPASPPLQGDSVLMVSISGRCHNWVPFCYGLYSDLCYLLKWLIYIYVNQLLCCFCLLLFSIVKEVSFYYLVSSEYSVLIFCTIFLYKYFCILWAHVKKLGRIFSCKTFICSSARNLV